MKTLEEFVKEIDGSEELQKALKEATNKASMEEFLKQNGCTATAEEFAAYVKFQNEGEIDDENAGKVAGGGLPWKDQVFR